MTNVILLSPCAAQGGAERGLLYLAERLPRYGFAPRIILLENGPLEDWLIDLPCPVQVIPAGRGRQIFKLGRTISKLVDQLQGTRAVICNQSKGHIYGGAAAMLASIPEIWWQQQHPSANKIDLMAAAIPSSVVVCSSQASLQAQRRLTPWRRVETIHLGTAVEKLPSFRGTGTRIRVKNGWEGRPLVGIVGRLQAWKGQEIFLRAAALVAREILDVQFVVIGGAILGWEGHYPEQIKQLSEELGIASKTYFAGHQPNVYPWFDALDVVVHASFGQPFDHVLIEAMALGKPLVATSKGGSAEIVQNGVSGLLVPAGNETLMAKAIIELLKEPERAGNLGREAQKRAPLFSAELMTKQFAQLLQEVITSEQDDFKLRRRD